MHRSGTSAITRGLTVLGAGLGDNLMAAIPGNNDKGFWEDNDIYRLSEDVLAKAGSGWDRLASIAPGALEGPSLSEERRRASRLLLAKMGAEGVFAFKDPRTALLMPFWDIVFADLELDPRFIIALRNPLEVAESLARRDGFDETKGLVLWTKHMLAAIEATTGRPRVVVSYAHILDDPVRELARIAALIGAPAPDSSSEAFKEYADEFLETGLRRNVASDAEFARAPGAPEPARALYAALAAAAQTPPGAEPQFDSALLRRIGEALSAYGPLLSYADRLEQRLGEDRDNAVALDALKARDLARAAELSEAHGAIKALKEANAELFTHTRQMGSALGEARAELRHRDAALEEVHRQHEKARRQLEDARRHDEARAGAIEQWSTHARQLEAALESARRDNAALRRSLSWRLSAPVRWAGMTARNPVRAARTALSFILRGLWRLAPLSGKQKGAIADRLFVSAPVLFSWSATYRNWRAARDAAPPKPTVPETPAPVFEPLRADAPPRNVAARLIAYYLPQFHRIPENDAWWGEGFTEWTNTRRASPLFAGHYQPREPGDLGYYDLAEQPEIRRAQAQLARLNGIEGFCFYAYWFAGKRLLERPLAYFADDEAISLPFCLCWANENWSRRWDGLDQEILIAQNHSPSDDLAFIEWASRYLRNPRYLKVDGKPLLLVYRPALLPSARETAARWRSYCRTAGIGEIFLAYTQSFEAPDPADFGFDAAIEFPPNNSGLAPIEDGVETFAPFSGKMYDWTALVRRSQNYPETDYLLFRGVNPSWDNTARRAERASVFLGSAPALYRRWLENAVADTRRRIADPDKRLIFVNAWNEWAEGAYLEPDTAYGYAWLNATREAVSAARRRAVIVVHDLHRHGAQFLGLNLARTLKTRFGWDVATVACGDGELAAEFEALGSLRRATRENAAATARALAEEGYDIAFVNSAASGWMAPALADAGLDCVALIHELPKIIRDMKLEDSVRAMNASARAVVFPSTVVRDRVAEALGLSWRNAQILPQGLFKRDCIADPDEKEAARRRLVERLGFPADARIMLGIGYGDARKAPDIFTKWALALIERDPRACAVWLGELTDEMRAAVDPALREAGARAERIRFLGFTADTRDFYAGADLYALSSREDPFPSTALDALASATPVLMRSGAGGIEDLAREGCVFALADDAPARFAAEAGRLLANDAARAEAGLRGRDLIRADFGFGSYAGELLRAAGAGAARVSVVVPNYNYARHLEQRLRSILDQSAPPFEIIFLDDASADESVAVAERVLAGADISYRIVRNEKNSGDVFAQWRKGVALARGEHVWIAEADDWADPDFLAAATAGFASPDVVLSYTQSRQANDKGEVIAPDYLDYVADISVERWKNGFVNDGPAEIVTALSIKNSIPNVSAVVFRRDDLARTLEGRKDEIARFRVAGDWCVYVNLLRSGKAHFDPRPLNFHRRHDESVTISRFGLKELAEIARMQAFVAAEFDVPAETRARAQAYLDGLIAHFDLRAKFAPREIEDALSEARR